MGRMHRVSHNNTSIVRQNDAGAVILHGTPVVTWDKDRIILNSGGWRTTTTKARMMQASNQYGLGYCVFQRAGEWYVTFKGAILPFKDGMTLKR